MDENEDKRADAKTINPMNAREEEKTKDGRRVDDVSEVKSPTTKSAPSTTLDSKILTQDLLDRISAHRKKLVNGDIPTTFHVWDFAGQEIYYNTHHFFLTSTAIYIIVTDISLPIERQIERMKFWLHSVRSYAPDAPILIIGTHGDLLVKEEEKNERMLKIFTEAQTTIEHPPKKEQCIVINCKESKDPKQSHIKKMLEDLAISQSKKSLPCPLRWMLFFDQIVSLPQVNNDRLSRLEFKHALQIASKCGFNEESNVRESLQYFHNLGFLLHYPELDDLLFLEPQKLIYALRTIVTATNNPLDMIKTQCLFWIHFLEKMKEKIL